MRELNLPEGQQIIVHMTGAHLIRIMGLVSYPHEDKWEMLSHVQSIKKIPNGYSICFHRPWNHEDGIRGGISEEISVYQEHVIKIEFDGDDYDEACLMDETTWNISCTARPSSPQDSKATEKWLERWERR